MEKVRIKQATQKGYIECAVGGGWQIYLTRPVKLEEVEFRKVVGFVQLSLQQKPAFVG